MSKNYLTRTGLLTLFQEQGLPITKGTLDKLCAPSCGKGPPVASIWPGGAGRHPGRPLYEAEAGLKWVEERLKPPQAAST